MVDNKDDVTERTGAWLCGNHFVNGGANRIRPALTCSEKNSGAGCGTGPCSPSSTRHSDTVIPKVAHDFGIVGQAELVDFPLSSEGTAAGTNPHRKANQFRAQFVPTLSKNCHFLVKFNKEIEADNSRRTLVPLAVIEVTAYPKGNLKGSGSVCP